MEGAWDLVKGWSFQDRVETLHRSYREGFRADAGRHKIGDLARELVAIASEGLRRQDCRNEAGDTEEVYLDSIRDRVDTGITIAEGFLGEWERHSERSDVRWLMDYSAYRNPAE